MTKNCFLYRMWLSDLNILGVARVCSSWFLCEAKSFLHLDEAMCLDFAQEAICSVSED